MAPQAFDVPPGSYVDLPAGRRAFVRMCEGPPGAPTLVLLHGLGSTAALSWAGMFADLRQRFRVVAMDLRGHGRGPRTREFRLEDCADDAAAVLDALGIRSCVAAGYSMGGPVAMLLWQRHPEAVDGLVLVATSHNFGVHPVPRLGFEVLRLVAAGPVPLAFPVRLPLPSPFLPGPLYWALDELGHHQSTAILQAAAAVGRFASDDWVNRIDVPVAVVATTHDRMVPVARQARMALSIPTAVLHPVESGHLEIGPLGNGEVVRVICGACSQVADRAGGWSARRNGARAA